MTTDPTAYILAASLISGSIGFFGACLMTSRTVRRANLEGFKEAARLYQSRSQEP